MENEIGREVTILSASEILVGEETASRKLMEYLRKVMQIKIERERELEGDASQQADDRP